jgi:large conductance mechanosensitive channel
MWKDFKAFIMRGNVLDLAVGVIIGAAFGSIVSSLVNDVIMPPIGLVLGNVKFDDMFAVLKSGAPAGPYQTLADAQAAGAVTLNYGAFITHVVSFLILAFVVVRWFQNLNRKQEAPPPPNTRECPFCMTAISLKATRCPACTSEVKAA